MVARMAQSAAAIHHIAYLLLLGCNMHVNFSGIAPAVEAAMLFEPATPPRRPARGDRTVDSANSMDSVGAGMQQGNAPVCASDCLP